jgi:hypothetical protein
MANNILEFSDVSPDVVKIQIQNCNGTYNTGTIDFDPATTTQLTWPMMGGLVGSEGTRCVQVKFRDDALNWTPDWISATIYYDPNAPAWSSIAASIQAAPTGGGGKGPNDFPGEIEMHWTAHPEAQCYGLNWQRTTDYPLYSDPFPGFPPTITSDFQGPHDIGTNDYVYETIGLPGIYFMSVFFKDMGGNWSTDALKVATQNYYGGDFELWGGLRIDDYLTLANSYFSSDSKGSYDDVCDIGPTNTGWIDGYTLKDGHINFDDLYIFTFNYDYHVLATKGKSSLEPMPLPKMPVPAGALVVSAEIPERFMAGDEFETIIRVDDPAVIKLMSLSLKYDSEMLEAVAIEQGDMFDQETALQLNRITGSSIDIDGTILGSDVAFVGSEIATIKFHALASGTFEFSEPEIRIVNDAAEEIEVTFSNVFNRVETVPNRFALSQNYPNPFNPSTNVDLALPAACDWRVDIFNVVGQLVRSYDGYGEAGVVTITWDGTDQYGGSVASGIYFYKAVADNGRFTQTRKMVLMK